MTLPSSWEGVAFNQATASENRIHADDVARQYGFRGGLVPGVTVYAYLAHPAVVAWGKAWLERGRAHVALKKPLYDGAGFRVSMSSVSEDAYEAELVDADGVVCATARVSLPEARPERPRLRGAPPVGARDARPPATPDVMARVRGEGLGALRIQWREGVELDRYVRDWDAMPDLVRLDRGGFAHPAFTLGLANWVLARNVRLGPWIHVESSVQHHAALPRDAWVTVEATITDLFEKKGNHFVDLDVVAGGETGAVLSATHRAIYVPRPR